MIPWLIIALVAVVFAVVFVAQRRSKAEKIPSHYVVLVDGFPVVHVPREAVLTMKEARGYVVGLKEAYRASWAVFSDIYGKVTREAPIDTIGMSVDPVHKTHPEVVWFAPTSKMRLRFQDSMYYHFVGELHNMFRYNLYGVEWISKTKNIADAKKASRAAEWIEKEYGV